MASSKINPAMLTAGILFVVITGSGSYLWYSTGNALSETNSKLEQEKAALTRLQNRPNFPSEENIKIFQGVIDDIEKDLSGVRNTLLSSEVNGENISGDAFQTRFVRVKQQLTDTFEAVGIALPENFQFAFSFYATNTPSRDDTEALTQQLSLVELIARTLIDSRISRIESFKRMIVEKNLPPGISLDTGRGTSGLRPSSQTAQDFFPPFPNDEKLLYTSMPFIIEFESDENSLRRIVNHFSKPPAVGEVDSGPYFVIRAIEIINNKTSLPTLDTLRSGISQQSPTGSRANAPAVPNFVPGSIAPIIVVGDELLKTRMRVDYIHFKKSQNETAAR